MGNFLNFLSNNYIYFLIAAGVLFFALIGLLVDLKKKDGNESKPSEVVPEVQKEVDIPEPTVEESPVAEGVVDDFNPAPPMPVEDTIESVNTEENNLFVNNADTNMNTENDVNTQVIDNTPVMNFNTPSEPVSTETSQSVDTPEELR